MPHSTADSPAIDETDDVGYDPITETFHSQFDTEASSDAVVVAIVEILGTVTDHDPVEMPPLHDAIHAEALAELVSSHRGGDVDVTFAYEGVHVTVSSRGDVVARPLEE